MGIFRQPKCARCRQLTQACCCRTDPDRALRRAMRDQNKKR